MAVASVLTFHGDDNTEVGVIMMIITITMVTTVMADRQ